MNNKTHNGFTCLELWEDLGSVNVDCEDYTEKAWQGFAKGAYRLDIWSWFEDFFDCSVAEDLMNYEREECYGC